MPRQPRTRAAGLLALAALLLSCDLAPAQSPPPPRLSYVFPMGGQAGTSFELKVTGQDLDKAEALHFSLPDVKAEPVGAAETVVAKAEMKKPAAKPPTNLQVRTFKVTLPAKAAP